MVLLKYDSCSLCLQVCDGALCCEDYVHSASAYLVLLVHLEVIHLCAGFPMPFLLLGWRHTPLPLRTPSLFVVGAPVAPPPLPADGAVTREAVDELHAKFYTAVKALWEETRHLHPAYVDCPLELDIDD